MYTNFTIRKTYMYALYLYYIYYIIVSFARNQKENKKVRRPGIEPGSTAWKATMLTITPPTLDSEGRKCSIYLMRISVINSFVSV